ncbi:MAG: hypothetical protein HC893_03970 [Chloroflexaceae bacterium]|nr:hypothetical protein [Chloroflexaceae bacterium]
MSETPKFKDYFGIALAHRLAGDLQAQSPCFDAPRFVERIAASVDPLELKGRVALFSTALREHLPPTYPEALDVLAGILGPNGLCFSPDYKKLYVADTGAKAGPVKPQTSALGSDIPSDQILADRSARPTRSTTSACSTSAEWDAHAIHSPPSAGSGVPPTSATPRPS